MADMVKVKLNGAYEIILPKHRADRPEWYSDKGWEKERLASIKANTKPGDVVYYVGAEEGDMCALVAQWGAKLVMFEPNELVLPNVKAIWEANKLEPPIIFAGFAANRTTEGARQHLYNGFPPSADGPVIGNHGFKELIDPGEIPQIQIDEVAVTQPIPTMITMDVEGSEFEVLKGAEQTIINHKPIIYLSLHPEFLFRMFNVYGMVVRQWIIARGYEEKLLDYQHEAHFVYFPLEPK